MMRNKRNMRKETRYGIILIAVYNCINIFFTNTNKEIPTLHFLLGGLAGMAILQFVLGMLPEEKYMKLKQYKKSVFH